MKRKLPLLFVSLLAACFRQPEKPLNGTYYFASMAFPKYQHPAKLYDPISHAEFQQRVNSGSVSAYIGYFQNGKLVRIEKHLRGKTEYAFDYTYNANGKLIQTIPHPQPK